MVGSLDEMLDRILLLEDWLILSSIEYMDEWRELVSNVINIIGGRRVIYGEYMFYVENGMLHNVKVGE